MFLHEDGGFPHYNKVIFSRFYLFNSLNLCKFAVTLHNATHMRQLKITKSITNRESASLDKYLQEIGHEEMISIEEEVELAQRIRKGDRKALERLLPSSIRTRASPCPT